MRKWNENMVKKKIKNPHSNYNFTLEDVPKIIRGGFTFSLFATNAKRRPVLTLDEVGYRILLTRK